jgi:hypothetical protein
VSAGIVIAIQAAPIGPASGSVRSASSVVNVSPVEVPETFTPDQVSSPIDKWYYGLLADYPDTFGGVVTNAQGQYIVQEVGSNSAFEQAAQSGFDQLPTSLNVSVPSGSLELTFESVSNTLDELYQVRAEISQNWLS